MAITSKVNKSVIKNDTIKSAVYTHVRKREGGGDREAEIINY